MRGIQREVEQSIPTATRLWAGARRTRGPRAGRRLRPWPYPRRDPPAREPSPVRSIPARRACLRKKRPPRRRGPLPSGEPCPAGGPPFARAGGGHRSRRARLDGRRLARWRTRSLVATGATSGGGGAVSSAAWAEARRTRPYPGRQVPAATAGATPPSRPAESWPARRRRQVPRARSDLIGEDFQAAHLAANVQERENGDEDDDRGREEQPSATSGTIGSPVMCSAVIIAPEGTGRGTSRFRSRALGEPGPEQVPEPATLSSAWRARDRPGRWKSADA